MKIFLLGVQGCGKSTQGNLLSKKLGVPYLSSGHIFRNIAKEKTLWGRYTKETINAGVLIPDNKTVPIIVEYLKKPRYAKGYILDGFPRTINQAKAFRNHINTAIYIRVSDKEALWRLSGRLDSDVRQDNTIQAIRNRIKLFHDVTEPVLTYYKRRRILKEIDGEQSIAKVHKDIIECFKNNKPVNL